jgi:hypothetical protein
MTLFIITTPFILLLPQSHPKPQTEGVIHKLGMDDTLHYYSTILLPIPTSVSSLPPDRRSVPSARDGRHSSLLTPFFLFLPQSHPYHQTNGAFHLLGMDGTPHY